MNKHRTARGREFNMQAFSSDRGKTVAVGNSGRNAQGDLLGPGGKIIATKQEVAAHVHNRNNTSRESKQVKLNPMEQEISRKEIVGVDGIRRWEITYADGSVEVLSKNDEENVSTSLQPEEDVYIEDLLKNYKEEQ